jgi:hypothetical protein
VTDVPHQGYPGNSVGRKVADRQQMRDWDAALFDAAAYCPSNLGNKDGLGWGRFLLDGLVVVPEGIGLVVAAIVDRMSLLGRRADQRDWIVSHSLPSEEVAGISPEQSWNGIEVSLRLRRAVAEEDRQTRCRSCRGHCAEAVPWNRDRFSRVREAPVMSVRAYYHSSSTPLRRWRDYTADSRAGPRPDGGQCRWAGVAVPNHKCTMDPFLPGGRGGSPDQ